VIYSEVACPFWNSTVDYTFNPTKIGTVTYETSCSEWSPDDFNSPSAYEDGVSVALADFDFIDSRFLYTNGEPIINQLVVCGLGHQPGVSGDSVELKAPKDGTIFRRGDCWGDGNFDLKDPVLYA